MDILQWLGLEGKRVIIVHHDDLGSLWAMNAAYQQLPSATGAVMLPTMWAAACAGCRYDADLGVHITLNSEFPQHRWRPLTQGASLRDEFGYCWPTLDAAWGNIRTDEAEAEMRAQVEAALAIGIDVTHIDTHMGAVFRPDLAAAYLRVAQAYRVPAFVPNTASVPGLWIPDAWKPALEQVLTWRPTSITSCTTPCCPATRRRPFPTPPRAWPTSPRSAILRCRPPWPAQCSSPTGNCATACARPAFSRSQRLFEK
jgi:hypothetical protein